MKKLLGHDRKCVIYVRCSSNTQVHSQDDDVNMLMQFDQCQQIAKKRGLKPIKMFQDSQKDANPLDRPGFNSLINYIKVNKVFAVIVVSIDRLTRNFPMYLKIEKLLNKKNVKLICPDVLASFISSIRNRN